MDVLSSPAKRDHAPHSVMTSAASDGMPHRRSNPRSTQRTCLLMKIFWGLPIRWLPQAALLAAARINR